MRLPRVRFTVRGMMVAVAVAALVGYAIRLNRLSSRYEGKARKCALTRHLAVSMECGSMIVPSWMQDHRIDDLRSRRIAHYDSLAFKYRHAARYPWLPIAPDPPEPE